MLLDKWTNICKELAEGQYIHCKEYVVPMSIISRLLALFLREKKKKKKWMRQGETEERILKKSATCFFVDLCALLSETYQQIRCVVKTISLDLYLSIFFISRTKIKNFRRFSQRQGEKPTTAYPQLVLAKAIKERKPPNDLIILSLDGGCIE